MEANGKIVFFAGENSWFPGELFIEEFFGQG